MFQFFFNYVIYKTIKHRGVKLWDYIVKTMRCNYKFVTFKLNNVSSLNNIRALDN